MHQLLPAIIHPILAVVEHGGGHEASGGGAPAIPNLITLLSQWMHGPVIEFLHHWENVVYAGVVAVIISILAMMATRNTALMPGKLQNFMEMVVEGLDNFVQSVLGPQGRKYTPFLGTLFIYIWCMNMAGLIPGFMSPTGHANGINTTVALAVCVFLYVQYTGLRKQGVLGYLDHLAGSPRSLIQ